MEGVILFADDHIFDAQRHENKLFQKFNSVGNFSILPINNLTILSKTISSISTYKALILDWNFKRVSEIEGIDMPDENPFEFLRDNKIYSLVYIYSQADIGDDKKNELKGLYPGKIFFETKNSDNEVDVEYEKIISGIKKFEENNKHLIVPFVWSQSINQSAQNIFSELETADPNWIKEIYNTAKNDGAEPNTEVIGVFQNLLSESMIQNDTLIKSITDSAELKEIIIQDKESSLAKLYNRIYYTKLVNYPPFMTGDIFKFDKNEYAILFTPECDICTKKEKAMEFLIFDKKNFETFLLEKKKYSKNKYAEVSGKQNQLNDLTRLFNNGSISFQILPSFPFEKNQYNLSAFIDFETAFVIKSKAEFENMRTEYKLNSPYIYQLRQRYLAYIGRVGVPAIPQSLRLFNLK